LPLVIEVPTPRGNVAFLHGDVPRGMSWEDFRTALRRDPESVRDMVLWAATELHARITPACRESGGSLWGTRRSWRLAALRQRLCHRRRGGLWLDGMGGHLTCVNIQSPTEGLVEVRQVGTLGWMWSTCPRRNVPLDRMRSRRRVCGKRAGGRQNRLSAVSADVWGWGRG